MIQRCSQSAGLIKHSVTNYTIYSLKKVALLTLLGMALLLTTSCNLWGWWGSETNAIEQLQVDMYDTYYGPTDTNLTDPPVWTVHSGADVVVTLVNHGNYDHNWAVVKKGATVPLPYDQGQNGSIILHGIGMVYDNSQTTITFVAPEAGEYQVICTVDGHYPYMQGKLLVQEK